jgi:3-oxoadipate enol-lactonase
MTATIQTLRVPGPAGALAVTVQGPANGTPVLMAHSILSASMMWDEQAALLAARGYRVVRADTRGHGASAAPNALNAPVAAYAMADLVADSVAVLDALAIQQAHYIGLSLGGMSGFGLGLDHSHRVLSLLLCDARADMPAAAGAVWPERITTAQAQGCAALAAPTLERWFGRAFLDAQPQLEQRFLATAAGTSVHGFVGCAQAIMGLDYLPRVADIRAPTTLVVGANDGPLPQAMADLQARIAGARLEVIPGAGHLPNIDQAAAFNAAMLRHFERLQEQTQ